jgi:hypothetical protein
MNARTLRLALRKQRVLFESERLRSDFIAGFDGIAPLLTAVDHMRDGASWLKRNTPLLLALGAGLLIARPRRAFGWLRRGFFAWQAWRKLRRGGLQRWLHIIQTIRH